MEEKRKQKFQAKIQRILPIPAQTVRKAWNSEEVRVQAEKWCKPFCCRMAGCMELRKRTEQEQYECSFAQQDLQRCVDFMAEEIKTIQQGLP